MRRRIIIGILLLAGGVAVAGCDNSSEHSSKINRINREVTITNYLEAEGFNPSREHPLLSLEKIRGEQGGSSGSFSGSSDWFFLGGSGSFKGSSGSHFEPGTSLNFALITAKQRVSILEVPYSKIEFAFSPHVTTPEAHFTYDGLTLYEDNKHEGLWSVSKALEENELYGEGDANEKNRAIYELTQMSISQMIVSHLRAVTITLNEPTFSRDVLPLIHQFPSTQAKIER